MKRERVDGLRRLAGMLLESVERALAEAPELGCGMAPERLARRLEHVKELAWDLEDVLLGLTRRM